MNIGIAVSQFNEAITNKMLAVAEGKAKKAGITIARTINVHGAFDLPLAVQTLLEDPKIDAVATLGAVIKGETAHDQLITHTLGIMLSKLSLKFNKPVSLGVMGPGINLELAEQRIESYAKRAIQSVEMSYNELQHN